MSNVATRAAASDKVSTTGKAERRAIAMTRRVPRRYRTVRPTTTHAFRADSTTSERSPHEIPEHRVQAVIRALEAADLELRVGDDTRELLVERVRLTGSNQQRLRVGQFEGDDVLHPCQGLCELPRLGGLQADGMRVFVGEGSNRMKVPRRDSLPVVA